MPDDPEMLVKLLDLQLAQARLQRERHEKDRANRRAAAIFALIILFAVLAAGMMYLNSVRDSRLSNVTRPDVHASSK